MSTNEEFNTSDRFIPLRGSSFGSLKVSHTYPNPTSVSCQDYLSNFRKNDSNLNYMQHLYKKSAYNNILVEAMFENPRRTLYFSPKQKAIRYRGCESPTSSEEDWPVESRRIPLLTTPHKILDIPEVADSKQKLDWGYTGFIAMISRNVIHIQNPDVVSTLIQINSDQNLGECIKWNEDGSRLAVSMRRRMIALWDMRSEKIVSTATWSPLKGKISYMIFTSRLLIATTNTGTIQFWNHNLDLVKITSHAHAGRILVAKVSCNESYLATSGLDLFVKIWSMSTRKIIYQIDCEREPIISLDWHPWKECILVFGKGSTKGFCTLWNMNKPANQTIDTHPHQAKVDCLSFNPISAELVVTFWVPTIEEEKSIRSVVVQNSLNNIVDDISFHSTRVPNLLWDKTGRRLATLGADEYMAIWEFFGSQKKDRSSEYRFQKTPDNLNKSSIIR